MIVCSCAHVSDRELRAAVKAVAKAGKPLNFRSVYRQLGKRAKCGNCRPLIHPIIKQAHTAPGSRKSRRPPS